MLKVKIVIKCFIVKTVDLTLVSKIYLKNIIGCAIF